AESQELIPPAAYHALQTVAPLKRGKTPAAESAGITAVAEAHVAKTLPRLSRQVRAMVTLQLVTGMRPGEVVIMRGGDIDVSGTIWVYKPAYHKLEHHEI